MDSMAARRYVASFRPSTITIGRLVAVKSGCRNVVISRRVALKWASLAGALPTTVSPSGRLLAVQTCAATRGTPSGRRSPMVWWESVVWAELAAAAFRLQAASDTSSSGGGWRLRSTQLRTGGLAGGDECPDRPSEHRDPRCEDQRPPLIPLERRGPQPSPAGRSACR